MTDNLLHTSLAFIHVVADGKNRGRGFPADQMRGVLGSCEMREVGWPGIGDAGKKLELILVDQMLFFIDTCNPSTIFCPYLNGQCDRYYFNLSNVALFCM
jgi:hypothetical protein